MSHGVDIMIQTEQTTWSEDRATNTTPVQSEDDSEIGDVQRERRSIRTRSDLTLTDLPVDRGILLRERLRLLREEASLEEELQTVRSEVLRAKREVIMKRIQYYKAQKNSDTEPGLS